MRAFPRELQDQKKFLTLRAFLRRLTVVIVPGNINYRYPPPTDNTYRKMEIRDIVRDAGNIEFMKDTDYITIKVSYLLPSNSVVYIVCPRNIGRKHTTVFSCTLSCLVSRQVLALCSPLRNAGCFQGSATTESCPQKTRQHSSSSQRSNPTPDLEVYRMPSVAQCVFRLWPDALKSCQF